jgi:hypothetical protein
MEVPVVDVSDVVVAVPHPLLGKYADVKVTTAAEVEAFVLRIMKEDVYPMILEKIETTAGMEEAAKEIVRQTVKGLIEKSSDGKLEPLEVAQVAGDVAMNACVPWLISKFQKK